MFMNIHPTEIRPGGFIQYGCSSYQKFSRTLRQNKTTEPVDYYKLDSLTKYRKLLKLPTKYRVGKSFHTVVQLISPIISKDWDTDPIFGHMLFSIQDTAFHILPMVHFSDSDTTGMAARYVTMGEEINDRREFHAALRPLSYMFSYQDLIRDGRNISTAITPDLNSTQNFCSSRFKTPYVSQLICAPGTYAGYTTIS